MYWARMKDGRAIVVSNQQTRMVAGKEYFVDNNYKVVLLDGNWQTVRVDKMRPEQYGAPWQHTLKEMK